MLSRRSFFKTAGLGAAVAVTASLPTELLSWAEPPRTVQPGGPILLNSRGARMDRHAATRRLHRLAEAAGIQVTRAHPHMLRHTYVTTMLDAGADLRDVQIAARHADPRTTMRYDRARGSLDRHATYIVAAYLASAAR